VARLVYLGDSQIDVIPGKYLLLCYNHDKTGVIGKIGTILGENEINIASMHTGRSEKGGTAITVINIDSYVPEEIIKKLRGIKEIIDIKMLRL
jgi:D-3-phosphoglycerate dehydrogenase